MLRCQRFKGYNTQLWRLDDYFILYFSNIYYVSSFKRPCFTFLREWKELYLEESYPGTFLEIVTINDLNVWSRR